MILKNLAGLAALIALCASEIIPVSATHTAADPPTKRATIDLTIGGANETRDAYVFGQISGLATDSKGQIIVSDAKDNNIRVYSATGVHQFTIGQSGAGPGDFKSPENIAIAKDGKLWVKEGMNHRFSILDVVAPKGKFVRSIPNMSNSGTADRTHWDAEGRAIVLNAAPPAPGKPFRTVRSFVDSSGKIVARDTAPIISLDSVEQWKFQSGNGGEATYSKPFGAQRIQAFGAGGLAAFAVNTNYAVSLVDAHGKRIALLRRSVTPLPLSTSNLQRVNEQMENVAKMNKVSVSSLKFAVAKTKPVISNLTFDVDGRLWVTRSVADDKPIEADVYDRTGKWVAMMQWPKDVSLSFGAVSGDVGLGVATDKDGVQRVVRLRFR